MNTTRKEINMGFTRDSFPEGTHMCLIYEDETYRSKVISQFLASGLQCGEKVGYFIDTTSPEEVRHWLAEMNIELPSEAEDEKFTISQAENTYCPQGEFVPSEMLDRLRAYYQQAIAKGYIGTRVSGEMSWALKGIPGSERLMEYEALINEMIITHPLTPICQYDARRFDGAAILNVLRVHPMMIVRDQIVQNPYYMKPRDFLRQVG